MALTLSKAVSYLTQPWYRSTSPSPWHMDRHCCCRRQWSPSQKFLVWDLMLWIPKASVQPQWRMMTRIPSHPQPHRQPLLPHLPWMPPSSSKALMDAASLLNVISVNQPVSDEIINMDNGKGLTFDPFCCFSSNSSKLYDIRDFVTTMPSEHKEGASNKVGEMKLNLMDTKPKLDNITQMQYMEASLHILRGNGCQGQSQPSS